MDLSDILFFDLIALIWLGFNVVIGWFGRFLQGVVLSIAMLVIAYLVTNELAPMSNVARGVIDSPNLRMQVTYIALCLIGYFIGMFLNLYVKSAVGGVKPSAVSKLLGSIGGMFSFLCLGSIIIFLFFNFLDYFYPNFFTAYFQGSVSYNYFFKIKAWFI